MNLLEIALAFMAGVYTLFSPCSFPLLPGYISYYLGSRSIPKAAISGLTCALSIIAVFFVVGLTISALGVLVSNYVPFLQVGASIVILSMGIVMVSRSRAVSFSVKLKAPKSRGFIGLLLFGIAYGLAAAGCSAPIFFSMLLYALSFGGTFYGAITFIAYAMGISLPMIALSIIAMKVKALMLKKIMKASSLLQIVGGSVLIAVGSYLLHQSLLNILTIT